jgi:ribosomal-protein-alanine N-acetyltransferase
MLREEIMDDADTYINIESVLEFYDGELDDEHELVLQSVAAMERDIFTDAWNVDSLMETLQFDYNKLLIAKSTSGNVSETIGYLLYNEIGDDTELLKIAVDKRCRGKHIGRRLLESYLEQTKGKCLKGFLEVRSSNLAARRLYETSGYKMLNTRKSYYSNPVEDAVVYEIDLERN